MQRSLAVCSLNISILEQDLDLTSHNNQKAHTIHPKNLVKLNSELPVLNGTFSPTIRHLEFD